MLKVLKKTGIQIFNLYSLQFSPRENTQYSYQERYSTTANPKKRKERLWYIQKQVLPYASYSVSCFIYIRP